MNQIDYGSNGGLGNTTILEEKAFTRSRFVGQFDPNLSAHNTSAQKGNRTEAIKTRGSMQGGVEGQQHDGDLNMGEVYNQHRRSSDNVLPFAPRGAKNPNNHTSPLSQMNNNGEQ